MMVSKLQIIFFYRQNRLQPPSSPRIRAPIVDPAVTADNAEVKQTSQYLTIFDIRSHTNSHNTLVLLETGYSAPPPPPPVEQESHTFWITNQK